MTFLWHISCSVVVLSSPTSLGLQLCGRSHWQLCNDLVSLSAPHGARSNLSLGLSNFWLASTIMPGIGPLLSQTPGVLSLDLAFDEAIMRQEHLLENDSY